MDMVRHKDVSSYMKPILLSRLLQYALQRPARLRTLEKMRMPVTTDRDEMQIACSVSTNQPLRHGESLRDRQANLRRVAHPSQSEGWVKFLHQCQGPVKFETTNPPFRIKPRKDGPPTFSRSDKINPMLDLAFVRANLALVKEKLESRGMAGATPIWNFEAIDRSRRESITQAESLKAERNKLSQDFGRLKREGADTTELSARLSELKLQGEALEAIATRADKELQQLLEAIPNLPQDSVPPGKDEHANRVEKVWDHAEKSGSDGKPDVAHTPALPALTPLPHWELGEHLGILDFERAAKITGARFVVHYGQGARLERALANFMLDLHTREPRLHRGPAALHGQLQVALRHRPAPQVRRGPLPLRRQGRLHPRRAIRTPITGSSPPPRSPSPTSTATRSSTTRSCPSASAPTRPASAPRPAATARTSAASSASTSSRRSSWSSSRAPKTPTRNTRSSPATPREFSKLLGLPYRRVLLCTGDMGFCSAKTYDLEVWLPGQQLYREISSCSNFEAFQARRANIRYQPGRRQKVRIRPHPQRQRPRRRPHLARHPRELPAGRRLRPHPRRPRPLHERRHRHHQARLTPSNETLTLEYLLAMPTLHETLVFERAVTASCEEVFNAYADLSQRTAWSAPSIARHLSTTRRISAKAAKTAPLRTKGIAEHSWRNQVSRNHSQPAHRIQRNHRRRRQVPVRLARDTRVGAGCGTHEAHAHYSARVLHRRRHGPRPHQRHQ